MAYSKKIRDNAARLYRQGHSCEEIAAKLKINAETLYRWKKSENWEAAASSAAGSAFDLRKQINEILSSSGKVTKHQATVVEKLTKSLERMERSEKREEKLLKHEKDKAKLSKEKVSIEYIGSLKDRFYDKLYPFQREFWSDPAPAKAVLKSRQTGFSYSCGGAIIVNGIEKERDQIVLSASQDQALIVRRYAENWCSELDVKFIPDGEKAMILPGGMRLWFLPSSFRTIQGYTCDVYMDEFAWHRKPKLIYDVIMPSTAVKTGGVQKQVSIMSTPYVEHDFFGELMQSEEGTYPFKKFTVDIYRAVKDGLDHDITYMLNLFDA